MYLFATSAIVFVGPLLLVGLPLLLRKLCVLSQVLPGLPERSVIPGFYSVSPIRAVRPTASALVVTDLCRGLVLSVTLIAALVLTGVGPTSSYSEYLEVRNAGLAGLLLGTLLVLAWPLGRFLLSTYHGGKQLAEFGISGVWHAQHTSSRLGRVKDRFLRNITRGVERRLGRFPSEDLVPGVDGFRARLLVAIDNSRSLHALSSDGLDVMRLLARSPENLMEGPHENLRGVHIRLLLLPPRSGHVDPRSGRLSYAETSLGRAGRGAEEHWRLLKHMIAVGQQWVSKHGVNLQIRFLEGSPSLSVLAAGTRLWIHPWPNPDQVWLEVQDRVGARCLATAIRTQFESDWSFSSAEIDVPLTEGPTGSTVIRKGVELPRESRLHLVESD